MDRTEINNTVKEFFDSWSLYKKFVDNNMMSHKEIYGSIDLEIEKSFKDDSFSILDLGCGDANFISKVLNKYNVKNYTGIDLSEEATKLARQNLRFIEDKINFVHKDFLVGMAEKVVNESKYDIVFTSYAIHHYTTKEKEKFFSLAKKLLNQTGILIIVDVVLSEHQILPEFLKEELAFFTSFNALTQEEFESAANHITTSDLPETLNTYKKMIANENFSNFRVICDCNYFQAFACNC